MEERPDVQKQILVEIAKKLPIVTRAQSGGNFSNTPISLSANAFMVLFICDILTAKVTVRTDHAGHLENKYTRASASRVISQCISFISADC